MEQILSSLLSSAQKPKKTDESGFQPAETTTNTSRQVPLTQATSAPPTATTLHTGLIYCRCPERKQGSGGAADKSQSVRQGTTDGLRDSARNRTGSEQENQSAWVQIQNLKSTHPKDEVQKSLTTRVSHKSPVRRCWMVVDRKEDDQAASRGHGGQVSWTDHR